MKKVKYYKGDLIEYDIYSLVDFYDPILRQPTVPWEFKSQDETVRMAFSLAETLGELEGLGLSANQVGLPWRICVLNMGKEIWTMFNPQLIERSETLAKYDEGCLSYPGLYIKVPRSETIKVKFQAINGSWVEQEFSGLTAVCIQHELDHLDGKVYTDLISPIKLDMAKRKIKKNLKKMRQAATEYKKQVQLDKQTQSNPDAPEIQILPPNKPSLIEKPPEKFVYNVG